MRKVHIYIGVFVLIVLIGNTSASAAPLGYIYPRCQICQESIADKYVVIHFAPGQEGGFLWGPPILYAHLTCALVSLKQKFEADVPLKRKTKETRKICVAPGCDSTAILGGFCGKHIPPEKIVCPICGETTLLCNKQCGNSPCVHGSSGEKHKLGCLLSLSPKELETLMLEKSKYYEDTK